MSRLGDWLEERTGYRRALQVALDEPVRGGASWAYVFGSVLTFVLLLQAATGVLLALYYSPSSQTAWASVAYIQDQVTLGWLIRGLHSHGASAMVILAGLHMLQVAIYGAYKKPREVNWIVGVLMLGLILAFALTGYLLPWDQKGYWATKVATGILGSTPLVGGWLQRAIQGGNEYGNLTLTRFYAIHVFILPALTFGLVAVHVLLFRKHGVTPKWGKSEAELDARTQPFWPDQLFKDMIAILAVALALFAVTGATKGVPLEAPADPASGYDARPEWYFLPLFQLLKYFHGAMEQVAALGAPLIAVGFLLLLPFLDRSPDRSPARRVPYLAVLFAGFIGSGALVGLAVRDDASDPALAERQKEAHAQARLARTLARTGVPAGGGVRLYDKLTSPGKKLFDEHCAGCHVGDERKGPEIGPGYNSRAWIREMLLHPDDPRFFGLVKAVQANDKAKMPAVTLAGAELDAVVEWLYAQTGARDVDRAMAARGLKLIEDGTCSDCHHTDGESVDGTAPNLGGRGSRAWLMAFVADAGQRRFFGAMNEMPAFMPRFVARVAAAHGGGEDEDDAPEPPDRDGDGEKDPSGAPLVPSEPEVELRDKISAAELGLVVDYLVSLREGAPR